MDYFKLLQALSSLFLYTTGFDPQLSQKNTTLNGLFICIVIRQILALNTIFFIIIYFKDLIALSTVALDTPNRAAKQS